MIEELGKWLLDIAKYIVTAYVLVRMFGNDDGSIWTLIGAVFFAALTFGTLWKQNEIKRFAT